MPDTYDKEFRKEYNKRYYAEHKTRVLSYLNAKIECENCGKFICKSSTKTHRKSHLCVPRITPDFLESDNEF
jgi:hypothetical protein